MAANDRHPAGVESRASISRCGAGPPIHYERRDSRRFYEYLRENCPSMSLSIAGRLALVDATLISRDNSGATLRSTFTRNIMRVKCGPAAWPFRGAFYFSQRVGTSMEQIRNADHISVIRDEFIEPRSAKIEPASIQRIDRALTAAANNLDEARRALEVLCGALPDSADDVVRSLPVLLTVRETCKLLGYHKTKVYDLMKRGLLPYVVETRTGHRRVEYRAVQQLVKRLRTGRLERKAS